MPNKFKKGIIEMKKREYEAPEIELLKFKIEDCITTSGEGETKGDDPVQEGDIPTPF